MNFQILSYRGTIEEDREITSLLNHVYVKDGYTDKSYAEKISKPPIGNLRRLWTEIIVFTRAVEEMTTANKIKSLEQSCWDKRFGLGLFAPKQRLTSDPQKEIIVKEAKDAMEQAVRMFDARMAKLQSDEDKKQFLNELQHYLSAAIAGTCDSLGDKSTERVVRSPKWFFLEKDYEDYDTYGLDRCPIRDHFTKRNGKYVSHEYGLSYGQLKAAIQWADERRTKGV